MDNTELTYKYGFKEGLSIFFAYFPVGLTFGVLMVKDGFSLITSFIMSVFCNTASGQFVGVESILGNATYISIFLAMFLMNLRMFVLGISLAQRLDPNMPWWKRLLVSFANTDEVFSVAMQKKGYITAGYFLGLFTLPYIGWVGGTVLGILLANILPLDFLNVCKIAMHAMFVALIVPPIRNSKPILYAILISLVLNGIMFWIPALKQNIDPALSIIICTVISALVAALLDRDTKQVKEGK